MSHVPSYKEFLKATADAHTPEKKRAVNDAINKTKKLFDMYNKGLLTPHDLADDMVQTWADAEGESR